MRLPTYNPVTLPFGATTAPYTPSNSHKGTDFAYTPDDTIYAVESGQVTLVPNNGNDGNGIYMRIENRFWGYLHTSKYLVENAAWVTEGQPIAIMGDTGAAQGKHLHLALKVDNAFVDPLSIIPQKGEDVNVTEASALRAWVLGMDLPPEDPGFKDFKSYWVGKHPEEDMLDWLLEQPRHKDIVTKARNYPTLEAQLNAEAKELKPGKWLVKG